MVGKFTRETIKHPSMSKVIHRRQKFNGTLVPFFFSSLSIFYIPSSTISIFFFVFFFYVTGYSTGPLMQYSFLLVLAAITSHASFRFPPLSSPLCSNWLSRSTFFPLDCFRFSRTTEPRSLLRDCGSLIFILDAVSCLQSFLSEISLFSFLFHRSRYTTRHEFYSSFDRSFIFRNMMRETR